MLVLKLVVLDLDENLLCEAPAQGEGRSPDADLDGPLERGRVHDEDLGTLCEAHV